MEIFLEFYIKEYGYLDFYYLDQNNRSLVFSSEATELLELILYLLHVSYASRPQPSRRLIDKRILLEIFRSDRFFPCPSFFHILVLGHNHAREVSTDAGLLLVENYNQYPSAVPSGAAAIFGSLTKSSKKGQEKGNAMLIMLSLSNLSLLESVSAYRQSIRMQTISPVSKSPPHQYKNS
ncbi:hypothetical protein PHYBLDRAFT_165773 [Phycomyces blakesleeanus NRRL 1555(-)]|uniref:Uncharacterized protein n=1 Tax=Phycomyces blakesleeanus (strain ATCC 8743b / DSM 1359 / FGSC 10004 / NBRC 33097 / NRRL 1555) TaxID=763407 RepID=A0A167NFN2_PHYB8|nr:hypothetical protein PHYBLDRAFT_165773 [Phycomyces blakesleeanus NRRL 1555(-)]OAD75788.1 hypothetical protein PHYBLDRAFT_165773 [Phycomyces blakesleeanus NRRL 1555(-)]|eukprot:XP_018293828.1 hypothetical protein PHYBLDRAFT_165773 [Phycomyces blakesleeanus NRRL 1555(-)]